MKKILIPTIISLTLALAGCRSTDTNTKGWSKEELKLFKEYAYGEVLPAMDFKGDNKLTYDEDYDALMLVINDITIEQQEAYSEQVKEAGYEITYDSEEDYYYGEKELIYEGNTRYLDYQFYIDENEEGDGYAFFFYVYDPYDYSWPEDIILDCFDYLEIETTNSIVPFETDRYMVDTSYIFFGSFSIFCFTDDINAEVEYSALIKAQSWTIEEERDEYEYLDSTSPDGNIGVDFCYYDGALELYIYALGEE